MFSAAPADLCCDCKASHLSGFDLGSLQLLLSVIGIVRRADLEREDPWWEGMKGGAGGGVGWTRCKHDNLQVSQFQAAGWPDTLGKHRRSSAEQRGAGQQEDESSLITKGSNCPPQPGTPHPGAEL